MNAYRRGFVPALLAVALLTTGFPAGDALSQDSSPSDEPAPPWELARRAPEEPRWAPLLRLREAEAIYRDTRWWATYLQLLAQQEAALGNHAEALRAWDSLSSAVDSVGVLPPGAQSVDAIDYLSAVADTAQILMINERHHAASDRLLTLTLLPILWEKGFRYFAAETFSHEDEELNSRSYPIERTGIYTQELVFGAVVREARRLGYTLVPYESTKEQSAQEDDLTPQQRRDRAQARNLQEAIFESDPLGKLLLHAGYSHIVEQATERWHPMALYLKEMTGIDPVTVDQTRLSERSEPSYEHPAYRASLEAGLLDDTPIFILDGEGKPYLPTDFAVDLQVLTPRSTYSHERPDWMDLGGRRTMQRIDVPECGDRWCFVEARFPGETPDAIPLDATEMAKSDQAWLFLPPHVEVLVQAFDEGGATLAKQKVVAGEGPSMH